MQGDGAVWSTLQVIVAPGSLVNSKRGRTLLSLTGGASRRDTDGGVVSIVQRAVAGVRSAGPVAPLARTESS